VLRLESCLLDIEASVDAVLVLTHATPARALRAYFCDVPVVDCMGEASSPETLALASNRPSVLEIKQQVGGGWVETIHFLDAD
jgi:broad specificity phosphatase PhoE